MLPSYRATRTKRDRGHASLLRTAAILGCAVVCLARVPTLAADSDVWATHGPYGVGVEALAVVAPDTLYAGTVFGGVFKSTDGGDSWTAVNTHLSSTNVFALAIDPVTAATIYAGSVLGGVFKSTDGGNSWSATGKTPIGYALAIDPVDPSTLYVGTVNGVFKTVDGGDTWSASGLADVNVSLLTIDPTTPGTLYAGTGLDGVFKSVDSGATWRITGLQPGAFALAVDPITPSTLYAGTAGGVLKSTDGGGEWTAAGPDPNAVVYALAIDHTQPDTVYAAAMYADGTGVGGVFVTTNGGDSWAPINNGLTNVAVGALAIDTTVPRRLYAATGGGVFAIQPAALPVSQCASSGVATVTDLVTMVNIALGDAQPPGCLKGVASGGQITVATIVQAVNRVLRGGLD